MFDGPSGYAATCEAWAKAWAPRRPLSTSAWAARYRRLSGKSAAEPGPWRNERIPYLRAVMDALDPSHPAPLVIMVASSQVGKSECGLNWIGKTVHQNPGSFLALFPNEKAARKWVRVRLNTMLAETPELRRLVPLGRRSDSGNTLTEKHFNGGVLFTGSANIPTDVASISVPYLLLEEIDRMPLALDEEGDPVDLAMRRSTAFPRSKCFIPSTPTTEENSRVWPFWLGSTMNRFFMPCPHCDHPQYMRWEQLKWVSGKPSTAIYVCESEECAAGIEERHKTDMLHAGEWKAEHPEREHECVGFAANGLMTPIGLGDTWAKHAAAWERAQGSQSRIQVFYNTRLGEVHKGERQKVQWEQVYERREPYPLRTVPRGTLILTSGTDVQSDRVETQILGHSRGERVTVIDYAVHYGDPTRPELWAKLDEYLAREFVNEFGVKVRLSCSLVDAGYLPDHVLNFTRSRKSRGIFACRGSTMATRQPIGRPSFPDVKVRGRMDQRGAQRYELGVSLLKHWLFEQLRSDGGLDSDANSIASRHIRFSDQLPEDYFRQLTAEVYDPKAGWVARANYHRNEALDTLIYARAAAMHHSIAIHRMRELDWQRLEQLYEPKDGPASSAVAPAIALPGVYIPLPAKISQNDDYVR